MNALIQLQVTLQLHSVHVHYKWELCVSVVRLCLSHTVCHSGKFSIKTVVHSVFLTVSINLFNSNPSLNLKLSVYRGHIFIIICTVTPEVLKMACQADASDVLKFVTHQTLYS